ncbi:MAG: c-type cytochrome [Novosphingobium sp.]|jgi:cytochrome c|nr:c-type cytochrome [Novosphingobium sp.]
MKFDLAFAAPVMLALAIPAAGAAPAADAPDGGALFRQRCQSCHSVTPGQNSPLAPNLSGVVGRHAGSTGFNYSSALKASKLVWNRGNLNRFLSGPAKLVPGTRMVVIVSDPQQRAAIIDYLARTGH